MKPELFARASEAIEEAAAQAREQRRPYCVVDPGTGMLAVVPERLVGDRRVLETCRPPPEEQ